MYVKVAGMVAYRRRRGLGAEATDTTGASCPGSPGCPGYVAPGSADYQTSLLQEILANQVAGAVPAATPAGPTFTNWLNSNAGMVAIAAAVGLGLVVLVKAGR